MADVASERAVFVAPAIEDTGPRSVFVARRIAEDEEQDDTNHGPRDRLYNRLMPLWDQ